MAQRIKNVVLVHGAFADGSGWEAVANILKNDGYKVSVVQHPETSYADDQKYTKAAIEAMGGPCGSCGSQLWRLDHHRSGQYPNVAALVYIAAFALDAGESWPRSSRRCRRPPRRSSRSTTATGGSNRAFHRRLRGGPSAIRRAHGFFASTVSADAFTRRLRSLPGSRSPASTWSRLKTGRSIRDQERKMARRATPRPSK